MYIDINVEIVETIVAAIKGTLGSGENVLIKGDTNMSQKHCEEVMRCYLLEVVAQGKIEFLEKIAAEDMVDHTAVAAGWGIGRLGLERHVRYFRRCVPDLTIDLIRVIASVDEVVGVWRVKGTHSATLFGIQATGKTIEWTNASIFRLKNGKIIDYTGVWGSLEAVQQMGVPIVLPTTIV